MQSSGSKRSFLSRIERRWVIAFASLVIHTITDGVTYSMGLFYGKLLHDSHLSKVASALIASTFLGLSLCAVPLIHWITRKYGCIRIVIAGSVLASVFLLASTYALNFLTLYFTIGIGGGLGFAMISLPAMISVTSYFEDHQHLFGSGITSCGSGLGLVIFAPLIRGLLTSNQTHWQHALLIISALVQLLCVMLGSIFKPKNKDKEPKQNDVSPKIDNQQRNNNPVYEDVSHNIEDMIYDEPYSTVIASPRINSTANTHPVEKFDGDIRSVVLKKAREFSAPFEDPVFDLFLFSKFFTGFGIYIPYVFLVVQTETLVGKNEDCYLLLIVIGIFNLISYTATAYVSKRIWIEWIFVHNGCLIVNGILTLLSILCKDFKTLILYCTMYGITYGAYLGLTPVTLGNYLEVKFLDKRHEYLLFFQGLGAFLGPPMAGLLCDAKASYSNAFALGGSMTIISGLVLFLRPLIERYLGRGPTNTRVYDDCNFQT